MSDHHAICRKFANRTAFLSSIIMSNCSKRPADSEIHGDTLKRRRQEVGHGGDNDGPGGVSESVRNGKFSCCGNRIRLTEWTGKFTEREAELIRITIEKYRLVSRL